MCLFEIYSENHSLPKPSQWISICDSSAKRNYCGVVTRIEGIVAKLKTLKLADKEMCNDILSPFSCMTYQRNFHIFWLI